MSAQPDDVKYIKKLLAAEGISDYDPHVVLQLLELVHSYTSSVLQKAESLSEATQSDKVSLQDVLLATQLQGQRSAPPPMETLLRLAEKVNAASLPEIAERHGLRIPPEADSLIYPNYQLRRPPS